MGNLQGMDNVKRNLEKVKNNMWKDTLNIFSGVIDEGVNSAQQNAPWTDRTGAARNSISGFVVSGIKKAIGIIGIGVFYGKFLELCNNGKYRILRPTMFAIEKFLIDVIGDKVTVRL